MTKVEQLREQRARVAVMVKMLPGVARDALNSLMDLMEEQQQQLDQLTTAVNRLTEKQGDHK